MGKGQIAGILEGLSGGLLGYGAFEDGRLVGFITLDPKPLGSRGQYRQLIAFQVSREHRRTWSAP